MTHPTYVNPRSPLGQARRLFAIHVWQFEARQEEQRRQQERAMREGRALGLPAIFVGLR